MRAFRGAQLERVASSSASPAEAAHMTGHALDTWVRHYVGRGGPAQRTDARARLLDGRLGVIVDEQDGAEKSVS